MSRTSSSTRLARAARQGVRAALLTGLLTGLLSGLITRPALADPGVDAAGAQAAALRTEIAALQTRAEVAVEHYDGVTSQLADLTVRSSLARQQLDQVRQAASSRAGELDRRAAAIYMSGGLAGLYATVLDAASISDALDRVANLQAVLTSGLGAMRSADATLAKAAEINATLATLTTRAAALQAEAQRSAEQVATLLTQAQDKLVSADARVRALMAAQDTAAQTAALAASRAAFARLGLLGTGATPGTPFAARAIAAAETVLGAPYQWGATGPGSFDCSGLTQWAFRQAGLGLPRTAAEQWFAGQQVPLDRLAPGDLLFWATNVADPSSIHHVAIYVGDGLMLDAPHTGAVVHIGGIPLDGLVGAVRPGGLGLAWAQPPRDPHRPR